MIKSTEIELVRRDVMALERAAAQSMDLDLCLRLREAERALLGARDRANLLHASAAAVARVLKQKAA